MLNFNTRLRDNRDGKSILDDVAGVRHKRRDTMKTRAVLYVLLGLFFAPLPVNFPTFAPQQARAAESAQTEATQKFTQEELAQMLAPIALYPDTILSQLLIASTYPIEVIEADRWVKRNPGLQGEALDAALLGQDWDPSVKAMCHFPTVLALMSERISETTSIGNAFLAQEEDVIDMVQELRAKAHAQGNLATTPEQKVIVQKEKIIIEPANPRIVYVPYYDTMYIYGPWWYAGYPPYYWGPAPRLTIGLGISFWPGFYFSTAYTSWCRLDWHARYIYVDVHRRPRYVRHDRWVPSSGRWHHVPSHRRGVAYRDIPTARKYTNHPIRPEGIRRDPRVFSAPRVQDRLKDRRLNASTVREQRSRDSIRPQIKRNMPQRNVTPPRTQRPSSTQGARMERPGIQVPKQKPSRIQPQTRQRLEARPRMQKAPEIQPDRQVKQGIKPENRRLPETRSTARVQQPSPRPGREYTAPSWAGTRSARPGREGFTTRFGGSGRPTLQGPRGHVTPGSSSPAYLSGQGR